MSELHSKPYQMNRHERFGSLVSLDSVRPEDEAQILPDFPAEIDGRTVWVTAVLERTAVVEPAPGEPKILVNRRQCMVDPSRLRFAPSAARYAARKGREAARRNRSTQGHAA